MRVISWACYLVAMACLVMVPILIVKHAQPAIIVTYGANALTFFLNAFSYGSRAKDRAAKGQKVGS